MIHLQKIKIKINPELRVSCYFGDYLKVREKCEKLHFSQNSIENDFPTKIPTTSTSWHRCVLHERSPSS